MKTVAIVFLGLVLYATAEEATKEVSVNRSKLLEKLFYSTANHRIDTDELWLIAKPCLEFGFNRINVTLIESLIQLNVDIDKCNAIERPGASSLQNSLAQTACLGEISRPKEAIEEIGPIFNVCYLAARKQLRSQAKESEETTVSET